MLYSEVFEPLKCSVLCCSPWPSGARSHPQSIMGSSAPLNMPCLWVDYFSGWLPRSLVALLRTVTLGIGLLDACSSVPFLLTEGAKGSLVLQTPAAQPQGDLHHLGKPPSLSPSVQFETCCSQRLIRGGGMELWEGGGETSRAWQEVGEWSRIS